MIHILDAGPMAAYLSSEEGAAIVADILADNLGECYAHFFNLTEIYYISRYAGEQLVVTDLPLLTVE